MAATCVARMMVGLRISLTVGVVATFVSLVIGVTWGAIAGFVGGRVDQLMMRIVDVLYAMPFIFFVILVTVVFGRSIFLIFLAIGAVEWLTMARIVRGQTLALKQKEFVEAARAAGVRPLGHHRPPHPAEPARARGGLCHADHAGGHPAGELPLLHRPRRAGAADLARPADLGRPARAGPSRGCCSPRR